MAVPMMFLLQAHQSILHCKSNVGIYEEWGGKCPERH